MLIGLIAIYIVIILMDIPGIFKANKKIKFMIVYLGLLSFSFLLSVLELMDKTPVSPTVIIETTLKIASNFIPFWW